MTTDKHQKERMRAWIHVAAHTDTDNADYMLAAFDKRFPAPTAVEVANDQTDARERINRSYARGWNDGHISGFESAAELKAELAALREKARLFDKLCEELPPGWKQNLRYWDAVASGKVDLVRSADGDGFYANDKFRATATEAVQAAIDAGALK